MIESNQQVGVQNIVIPKDIQVKLDVKEYLEELMKTFEHLFFYEIADDKVNVTIFPNEGE